MALYTFYQIFRPVDANTLAFINRTQIGSNVFEAGSTILRGQIVAGINFFDFIGKNIEVTPLDDGTMKIDRVYV